MNVCVIGLGYVGLTLALSLVDKKIKVYGVDKNDQTIISLKSGKPTVTEKDAEFILQKNLNKNFFLSSTIPETKIDVFVISVGTPLDEEKNPIIDYVISASKDVANKLQKDQLVVLRSTVPVGTTRNLVIPIMEKESNLKSGKDFQVVFAPERTAEGVAIKEMQNLPQIIGGISNKAVDQATDLFLQLTSTIVPVSSLETAEMIKLIDNTYRDVRFAYSNEIALICEMLDINATECITKANFNYKRNNIPTSSPGVGGPCLSKDSYLLSHTAKQFDYSPNLIMHSRWLNEFVPSHLALKIIQKIKDAGKDIRDSKIFVIGFAFKGNPETADFRNSSTLILINELKKHMPKIFGYDPVVLSEDIQNLGVIPTSIKEGFENADCIIFMNNHKSYLSLNLHELIDVAAKPCIFADCWSMFEEICKEKDVIYTGVGIN